MGLARLGLRRYWYLATVEIIANTVKILISLAEKGSITSKEFGKAKIFWTKQVDFSDDYLCDAH